MKKTIVVIMILTILLTVWSMECFAEDASSAEAFYKDGLDYFEKKDFDNAYPYFRISGDVKSYAPAQNMLGICYRDGLGTARDLKEAENYFKLAAEQGDADAEANLAELANEKEKLYRDATALFLEEKYEEAKTSFEILGDYEFSKDFVAKCEEALDKSKNEMPTPISVQDTFSEKSEPVQEEENTREEERELKEAAQIELSEKRIVYVETSGGGGGDGGASGGSRGRRGGRSNSGGGGYYAMG